MKHETVLFYSASKLHGWKGLNFAIDQTLGQQVSANKR